MYNHLASIKKSMLNNYNNYYKQLGVITDLLLLRHWIGYVTINHGLPYSSICVAYSLCKPGSSQATMLK